MTMWQCEIITPFVGTGAKDDPNRPKLGDDYTLRKWEDITGTPSASITPAPNLYAVLVECEEAVLSEIKGDNTYFVAWSQEIVEEPQPAEARATAADPKTKKPTIKTKAGSHDANEWGQLRAYLARNKVSQAQITAVIGTGAQGRSRGEIAEQLRAWMKTLPKGK